MPWKEKGRYKFAQERGFELRIVKCERADGNMEGMGEALPSH